MSAWREGAVRRSLLQRLGLAASASVAVLIVAPAPLASAQIVVGQSIARVRIGDSMSRVRELLGTPSASPYTSHGEWLYSSPQTLGGFVGFRAGTQGHEHVTSGVTYVQTSSHAERTAAGIGPGSSKSQLRRAYGGYHCDVRACWTATRNQGQTVTTAFYLEGGQVAFVVVAGHSFQLRAELAL